MSKHNKFSFKFLGAVMESVNFKPDNFIKLFWHIAFIVAFMMLVSLLIEVVKFKIGMTA